MDVNAKDKTGSTSLHMAAAAGNIETVRYRPYCVRLRNHMINQVQILVDFGANVDLQDNEVSSASVVAHLYMAQRSQGLAATRADDSLPRG